MGKKVIRLTESELVKLVERIVKEQNEVEIEEGFIEDNFGWVKDAARKVATLFKREIMPEIPEDELDELKDAARELNVRSALSNLSDYAESEEGSEALSHAEGKLDGGQLSESLLLESFSDKVIKILARTGIISGIGMSVSGLVSFASMMKGYVDSAFLSKVHEIIDPYCSALCGPLAILVLFLGAALAFVSAIVGHKR